MQSEFQSSKIYFPLFSLCSFFSKIFLPPPPTPPPQKIKKIRRNNGMCRIQIKSWKHTHKITKTKQNKKQKIPTMTVVQTQQLLLQYPHWVETHTLQHPPLSTHVSYTRPGALHFLPPTNLNTPPPSSPSSSEH